MKKIYYIQTLQGENETVKVAPTELLNEISRISFGTKSASCKVIFDEKITHNTMLVSEDLLKKLKIPTERNLHIFTNLDTLHIGPLIGIFTAGFTDSFLRPIGERSLFFAKLLTMEKSVGVCAYVFGAHLIDWDEGIVKGYFYDEKAGWTQREIPLPHVIYDRLPNRRTENHGAVKKIKQRLQEEYLIPWYNPGFFNKWEIFQSLSTKPSMEKYLPATIYQPSIDDIQDMLHEHKHVYIKPANGSLGLGIYQVVTSQDQQSYYCRYHDGEENRLQKFGSLKKLIHYLFSNKNLDHYIVQQGIHLIRYDNRPIDFRIHTNRDEQGEWKVTAIAAKIAGKGSVTTHLNKGGMVKTLEELYPEQQKRETLENRLHDTVIKLSKAIASTTEGIIGEIGFDIGVDQESKIWLFEANSKPGRAIFSHPKLRFEDRLSRQLSISYGIYLTEQGIQHPEAQFQ